MIRDAIKYYFQDDDFYHISGEAGNGRDACAMLGKKQFDLVITDINMPDMDGLDLMEKLKEEHPNQKVLVLSMLNDAIHINKMISLGASGYILKNASKEELVEAIQQIVSGEQYYSEEVYKAIVDSIAGRKPKQRLTVENTLSQREREVLKLIVNEQSNQEIADQLFISVRTVEAHKRNLLDKTGSKNIVGLVMYAVERNLI